MCRRRHPEGPIAFHGERVVSVSQELRPFFWCARSFIASIWIDPLYAAARHWLERKSKHNLS